MNENKRAKVGDTIEWTLNNDCGILSGKTYQAEVGTITDEDYGVFAEYGPDYIPFADAKIIENKSETPKEKFCREVVDQFPAPIKTYKDAEFVWSWIQAELKAEREKLFEVIYSLYNANGGLTNTAHKIFEEMGLIDEWKQYLKQTEINELNNK